MVHQRRLHEYDENYPRVIAVLAAIHLDPHISSRRVQREIGISKSTFLKILKSLNHHTYHITLVQELQDHHFQQRIEFCQWALSMIENEPDFFRYVHFSDEAKFQSDGELNRHNCHY